MLPKDIIKRYKLKKHPEGGWYKEIIRSNNFIPYKGMKRNIVTSIYFLLNRNEISRWHKLDADEIWIFLDGGGLDLHRADIKNEKYVVTQINSKNRQVLVNSSVWQAAKPVGNFAFVACIVAPGFEFNGFKLLDKYSSVSKKLLILDKRAKYFV